MAHDFSAPSVGKIYIHNYVLFKKIGRGTFGEVWLGRHLVTNTEVAVKIVSCQGHSGFRQEVICLKNLNHPHITQVFEVMATENRFFLVMEYVSGGDFSDYLANHGPLTEEEARGPICQLVSALHYCQKKGIVHRDVKLENLLLDGHGKIKLADFGLSTQFGEDKLHTLCGSLPYAAPEILQAQPYDGRKVDVWSLGVVLYKILTGELPFQGKTFGDVKKRIVSGQYTVPSSFSEDCKNLVRKLFTLDPTQRPTLGDLLKDPWIAGEEQEMREYVESPWGELDPQVITEMELLGHKRENIEDTMINRKLNGVRATYLMLAMRYKSRRIRVRSFPGPDPNHCPLPEKECLASGYSSSPSGSLELNSLTPAPSPEQGPTSPPPSKALRSTAASTSPPINNYSPPASPELESVTPTPSPESRPATPLPGPKSQTATPSPAPQHGPGGSPTTRSSTSSPRPSSGGGGGATEANNIEPGHPDGGAPASSSARTQGRPGVAKRVFNFFLNAFCLRPCMKKKRLKRIKVTPE